MNTTTRLASFVLVLAVILSACAGGAQPGPASTEPMPEQDSSMPSGSDMETGAMEGNQNGAVMEEGEDDEMMEENQNGAMMEEDKEGAMPEENQNGAVMEEGKDDEMMEENQNGAMNEEDKEGAMQEENQNGAVMEETPMPPSPTFFGVELVEVRTGETFRIEDFKGKVVLVETLAMWCSKCQRQQNEVKALHALLGERDDFVSLGLDIDPKENQAALQKYIDRNGFTWMYAIAPAEVSSEIGLLYGAQFLNPPSTPMFVIDREGEVHLLPFGIKSAAKLKAILDEYLSEGM